MTSFSGFRARLSMLMMLLVQRSTAERLNHPLRQVINPWPDTSIGDVVDMRS